MQVGAGRCLQRGNVLCNKDMCKDEVLCIKKK